jgi:RimJ/RimL family protein N-acetyltransferase
MAVASRPLDGVVIRELTRSDRPALAFAFRRLGPASRYQRFLHQKNVLTAGELDRLAAVDHWHHQAFIAYSPPPRAPVAVARYVREQDFDTAELAIAVVDAWQRRGLGRTLVLALRDHALRAGIRRFKATLLHENPGAWALAKELGPVQVIASPEAGVADIAIRLEPWAVPASRPPRAARPIAA